MKKLRIFIEEIRGRYYIKPQQTDDSKWKDIKEGVKTVASARLFGNEIPTFTSNRVNRVRKKVRKWLESWMKENYPKAIIIEDRPRDRKKVEEKEKKRLICKQCKKPILSRPTPFEGICVRCRIINEITEAHKEDQEPSEDTVATELPL